MDLLPIQAVKPSTASTGPVPTADGEQGFSDLIETLLAGLTSNETGQAIREEGQVGEEQENPTSSDQPALLPESSDGATVTQVFATTLPAQPSSPVSEPNETSMPPPTNVESRVIMPERQVRQTPEDVGTPPGAAPGNVTTQPETPEKSIPAVTRLARLAEEPTSQAQTTPGATNASPAAGIPGVDRGPTIESEPIHALEIVPETADRPEPVEISSQDAGTEQIEVSDVEPALSPSPDIREASPVVSQDSPQVARIAGTPGSDNLRTATAELVERLTEWAARVEAGQRSDAISLRLADADGEMVVRLSLREGRLELSVTRPGGETLPWLADQLGDALTERGFDMAESKSRQSHDDNESDEARKDQGRSKTPHRHQDGILM